MPVPGGGMCAHCHHASGTVWLAVDVTKLPSGWQLYSESLGMQPHALRRANTVVPQQYSIIFGHGVVYVRKATPLTRIAAQLLRCSSVLAF